MARHRTVTRTAKGASFSRFDVSSMLRKAVVEALEARQYLTAVTSHQLAPTVLPHALKISVDHNVASSVDPSDVYLTNLSWGEQVLPSRMHGTYDSATNTVTFTFDDSPPEHGLVPRATLPNGWYQSTLIGDGVTDSAGNHPADNTISFFSLIGDANHDGMVNFDDYLAIDNGFNNHLTGWSNGDFNGNGVVNFDDYVLIDANYGTRLPTPQTTPMSIDATAAYGNGTIAVHWVAPTQSVDGYHIYRSRDGVHFTMVHDQVGQNSVDYLDSEVAEGAKYTYRVRAYVNIVPNGENAPPWEEVIGTDRAYCVVNLPGPIQLGAEDISGDGVTLTWSDNSLTERNFEVWMIRDGELGYGERVAVVPAQEGTGVVSTRVTGLTPLTGYTFYVTAGTDDTTSVRSIGCPVHTGPDISGAGSAIEGTQLAYSSASWDSSGGAWRVTYVKHPEHTDDHEIDIASGDEATMRFTAVDDGEYRVALTVTRGNDKHYTSIRKILVSNGVPVINSLTAPTHISGRHVAHFVSDVRDPGTRDVLNYQWVVKKKNTDNSYGEPIITVEHGEANFHFVPEPPAANQSDFTYRVELTVTDGDGGEASMVRKFTVANDSTGANGTTESVLTPDTNGGADAMAVQGDGKILLLGVRKEPSPKTLVVTRYNADLTIDTGFGGSGNGIAVVPLPTATYFKDMSLTVDPAGRIIVACTRSGGLNGDIGIARLTPNGSPDTSFNPDGANNHTGNGQGTYYPNPNKPVFKRRGNGAEEATPNDTGAGSVQVIQLGGKPWIIVGGWTKFGDQFYELALYTFRNDGTVAEADGFIIDGLTANNDRFVTSSMVIQPSAGSSDHATITLGGYNMTAHEADDPAQGDAVVARLTFDPNAITDAHTPAFTLDDSFGKLVSGGNGTRQGYTVRYFDPPAPDTHTGDVLKQVLVAPDGNVIAVGAENALAPAGDNQVTSWVGAQDGAWPPGAFLTLARYTAHGDIDTSFGGTEADGFIAGSDNDLVGNHLGLGLGATLQVTKPKPGSTAPVTYKIIVGGAATPENGGSDLDFYVARFDQEGALESNFGGPGRAVYTFDQWHLPHGSPASDFGTDAAMAVAFTDDGILAGGGVTRISNEYFGLLRYRPPTASNISLSATARTDGTISLNWIDGSWSEEGYLVERAPSDQDFGPNGDPQHVIKLAYLGGDASSLVDRHVEESTRYYYRVTALKLTSSGNDVEPDPAHQSNIATAFTLPKDVGWKPIDTVVFEENNLRGQQDLFSHVSLSSNGIYLLRASGVFDLGHEHDGHDVDLITDAEYANFASGQEDWQTFTWPGGGKANWGIAIDNTDNGHLGPSWGRPANDPHHTYDQGYVGLNQPVRFHIDDGPGYYDDNHKLAIDPLKVEIFRATPTTPAALNLTVDRRHHKVTLAWNDTSPHRHKRFYVDRKVGNDQFHARGTVDWEEGTSSYQFVDDSVVVNQHYTYRVYAREGDDSSPYSNIATAFLVNHPPTVTPIPTQLVPVESDFTYVVDAYDLEDQRELSYALVGDNLPGALAINPDEGLIHGYHANPLHIGRQFMVGVRVTDRDQESTDRQFALRVIAGAVRPPQFVAPDIEDSLSGDGKSAMLHEKAHDPNEGGNDSAITYSWRIYSMPEGAPEPTFNTQTLHDNKDLNVSFGQAGIYKFTVTAIAPGAPAAQTIHVFNVVQQVGSIKLNPENVSLEPGEQEPFTVSGKDQFDDSTGSITEDLHWTPNGHFNESNHTYTAGQTDDTLHVDWTPPGRPGRSASANIHISAVNFGVEFSSEPDQGDTRFAKITATVTGGQGHSFTYAWSWKPDSNLLPPIIVDPDAAETRVKFLKHGNYKFNVEVWDQQTHHRVRLTEQLVTVNSLPTLMDITPHSPIMKFSTIEGTTEHPSKATLTAKVIDQFGDNITPTTFGNGRWFDWHVVSGGGHFEDAAVPTPSNRRFVAPTAAQNPSGLVNYTVTYHDDALDVSQTLPATIELAAELPATAKITSPGALGMDAAEITRDTRVEGIIDYPNQEPLDPGAVIPDRWQLQLRRADEQLDINGDNPKWITIASGGRTSIGSLADGPGLIGTITPSALPDGLYVMRLRVNEIHIDNNSNGQHTETHTYSTVRVQIHTDLKLGNLTLPFTDLSVPIGSGPPINITRVYDSQHASEKGEFGYGWRLEGQDVQFRITARPGSYSSNDAPLEFRAQDLVYITLPGGQQQVFMFKPLDLGGGPLGVTYQPAFIPVDGSGSKLEPLLPRDFYPNTSLVAATNNGDHEFFIQHAGDIQRGYDPGLPEHVDSNTTHDGGYTLTTQDGTKYAIVCERDDTRKAHLTRIDDSNGNYILFSNGSITGSSSGIAATILRDTGTVTGVKLSSGTTDVGGTIAYTYDPDAEHAADLIGVTDRSGAKTTYEYADRLVLLKPDATGNVYAILYDIDGKAWNQQGAGHFESPLAEGFAAKYTLEARPSSSGGWFVTDLPGNLPAKTWFRAKFYNGTAEIGNTNIVASQVRTSTYQHAHYLTGIIDPRGVRTLSATYDEAGKLDSLVDAQNKAAPLSGDGFDGHSAIRQVTDLAGQQTTFTYNQFGDVIREVRPVAPDQGAITAWQVIVRDYAYAPVGYEDDDVDISNVLLSTIEYEPVEVPVTEAPDPNVVADPDYDLGNLVATHVTQFDGQNRHVFQDEVVGPNGRWMITTYASYDSLGHPTKMIDPNGNITKYEYDTDHPNDPHGRLMAVVNPLGERTEYTYDDDGRLLVTKQIRSNGEKLISVNTYYPDGPAKGLLASTYEPQTGLTHTYTYNSRGLTEDVGRSWTENNVPHNVIDSHTEYDAEGRVSAVQDGDFNWTYNYYDALGKLSYTIDKFGGNTISTYDTRGNLIRTLYPDGTETRTSYDAMGRAEWAADRYQTHTIYSIDTNTHVVTITNEDNDTLATLATHTIYDSLGRAVGTERRQNVLIKIQADASAQMTDEMHTSAQPRRADVVAEGTKLSGTTTSYDAKGRVSDSTSSYDPDDADPFEVTTHTDYWPDGRTKSVTTADGTPLAATTEYDENRRWTEELIPGGTILDADHFKVVVKHWNGSDYATSYFSGLHTATQICQKIVDDLGTIPNITIINDGTRLRLVATQDDKPFSFEITVSRSSTNSSATLQHRTVHTTWTKDAENHETTTEYDELGREVKTIFADTSFTETSYGEFGSIVYKTAQRKSSETPQVTENHYDVVGRLTDVYLSEVVDADPNSQTHNQSVRPHWQYTYDANGNQRTQVDPKQHTTTFNYNEQNRRTGRTMPDNVRHESWSYDSKGRLEVHVDFKSQSTKYVYDPLPEHGGRLQEEQRFNGAVTSTPNETTSYQYDDLGRHSVVKEFNGPSTGTAVRTTSYEYDLITGGVTLSSEKFIARSISSPTAMAPPAR
jgi:uncharacterized delta-60 repeat protein